MGTIKPDQSKAILVIAEQYQIFTHDPDRQLISAHLHFIRRGNGLPVTAQQPPTRRARISLRH